MRHKLLEKLQHVTLALLWLQVYATGYGHSGRLGLGGSDSVNTCKLIESLQHIVVKKVAVHSGGKHAMALSADGEVFSWGEGEDGKLGHGTRKYVGYPTRATKMIK